MSTLMAFKFDAKREAPGQFLGDFRSEQLHDVAKAAAGPKFS
jgi:hypothetical protein